MENAISIAIKTSLIFAGAMIVLVAVSFLMFGAAHGLSEALGVEVWLGFVITGAGFLLPILLLFMIVSFNAKREASKKKAEQKKAAEVLSRKISEVVDVRWWIQKYPFYATGAAAAAGFTVSGMDMPGKEPHLATIQDSIIAMALALAEDVVKEAVVPFVKEHLTDTQKVTQ